MEIQVFDFDEVLAVWEGKIEGFVYSDDEVWADVDDLERWRAANAAAGSFCLGCGILSSELSRERICPNCLHTDAIYGTRTG